MKIRNYEANYSVLFLPYCPYPDVQTSLAPQHPILKHLQSKFFPWRERQTFTMMQNDKQTMLKTTVLSVVAACNWDSPTFRRHIPTNRRSFAYLHGITTYNSVLFIVTTMRVSNPTKLQLPIVQHLPFITAGDMAGDSGHSSISFFY